MPNQLTVDGPVARAPMYMAELCGKLALDSGTRCPTSLRSAWARLPDVNPSVFHCDDGENLCAPQEKQRCELQDVVGIRQESPHQPSIGRDSWSGQGRAAQKHVAKRTDVSSRAGEHARAT